jgi:outer membrane putative beta-barrel porin/alpha-amylase
VHLRSAILASALLMVHSLLAFSQVPIPSQKDETPAPIQDNSFLIEEAYNQEDGVVQHISSFERLTNSHDWVYTQTDEWPLRTLKHQLSVTLAGTHAGSFAGSGAGWGDTFLNYRYQLMGNGETKLAIAPRLSLLLPTGDHNFGRGSGGVGLQTNLPLSIQHSRNFVTHWNAGATWVPRSLNRDQERASTTAFNLGQSTVWLASSRINLLLETLWTSSETVVGTGKTQRSQDLYVSPGIRWAHNFDSGLQIVPGLGFPVGLGPCAGEKGVILYLSFEHPFSFAHSRPN